MKFSKFVPATFAFCASLLLTGCGQGEKKEEITISIDPTSLEVFEDDSALVTVKTNSLKAVSYSCYDTDIATVSSSGRVIGKKAGSTTIVASVEDVSASCLVTVRPIGEKNEDYIGFETSSYTIGFNETRVEQIKPTYYSNHEPVPGATFTYATENENVATVSNDGTITIVAPGSTAIEVQSGKVSAYVIVDVYNVVINNVADWFAMLETTNNKYARFYLNTDLDFSDVEYEPFADSLQNELLGEVKGNKHVLKNITMKPSDARQSIFGYASAFTLSNIGFINTRFTSSTKNCGLFVSLLNHLSEEDGMGKVVNNVYNTSISNVLCDFVYSNVTSTVISENFYGAGVDNVFASISNASGKAFKEGNTYATSEHFYNWFGTSHINDLIVYVEDGSISVEPKKGAADDYLALSQVKVDATNSLIEANYLASKSFDPNIWVIEPNNIPCFVK